MNIKPKTVKRASFSWPPDLFTEGVVRVFNAVYVGGALEFDYEILDLTEGKLSETMAEFQYLIANPTRVYTKTLDFLHPISELIRGHAQELLIINEAIHHGERVSSYTKIMIKRS